MRYDDLLPAIQTSAVIVTAAADGERAGCLVGFNTPCSLDPPLYAVWLSHRNRTQEVAQRSSSLAVHLLSRDQLPLAELFGSVTGWDHDKFAACRWTDGPDGVPLLDGAAAWFSGAITDRLPCGDHTLVVVRPEVAGGEVPHDVLRSTDIEHLSPGNPP